MSALLLIMTLKLIVFEEKMQVIAVQSIDRGSCGLGYEAKVLGWESGEIVRIF